MKKKYYKWAVEGEDVHDGWFGRAKGAVFRFDDIYQADRWVFRSPKTRCVTCSSNPLVKKARESGSFRLPDPEEIAAPKPRSCCEGMEEAVSRRCIWSQSGLGTFVSLRTRHNGSGSVPVSSKRISFCPWCGTPLQPPAKVSPPGGETTPSRES